MRPQNGKKSQVESYTDETGAGLFRGVRSEGGAGEGTEQSKNLGAGTQSGNGALGEGEGKNIGKALDAKGIEENRPIKYNKHNALESNDLRKIEKPSKNLIEEALDGSFIAGLKTYGKAVLTAQNGLSVKYLELCEYIRKNTMTPSQVKRGLEEAGFNPQRISEVKRVCFTSAEIYQEFKDRLIGWKTVLAHARGGERGLVPIVTRFNRWFAEFDRINRAGWPEKPFFTGEKGAVMAWRYTDIKPGEKQTITVHGYKVTVENTKKTND